MFHVVMIRKKVLDDKDKEVNDDDDNKWIRLQILVVHVFLSFR